ncbi:RICIN domain-containing protein [Ruminococcus bicirculans (ex Wegman et al. 2014)]|uniref:RICIN domain-containing protein n=2 Tax=Ruminococcus TaxID=1263 RepID=UPI001647AE5A|nr:RICIN domain-containing protein [Ruminococcus bicirculans (ex Wegman et al. 2014)]MBC3514436.1 RICIN domain-containing protein [Ruminococcus bicirculans (ex Wegman et al. 2014)]
MKKRIASLFTSLLMIVSLMVVMPTMSVSATQSKINNFNKSYTLTGNAQNDMVAIAKAQIGMTQSQLGYTEQWCADFVSDCARLANQSIAIPANGSCYSLMNAVKNAGGHTVSKSEALPGDLVFFSSSSNPNGGAHVELVYGYSNGVLKSIGGNCHIDGVSKVYDRSNGKSSSVSYYCVIRPNYTSLLPGKSTINVKPGTSYKCTTFNWTASSNTKVYSIKIHKNGTLFKENTTAATSWSVILPVGDYEAYVDSCNDSGYTCSNTVKFTIEKGNPVPSSTTVSASAGTNYTPTSISWLKTANTNEYDVKIWRGTAQKGEAYKILWSEKGTGCLVDLPAGYYEAYVDSRNDYECSMSANIVKFTVTDGNYLDIGDDFYASLLIYKNWLNVTNENGSITVQKSENASARQIWFFDRQSDGSYTIKNCADGSYLDSCSPNGGLAQSKKYSGSNTQKWYIFGRWSGEYYFKPKSVNIVLDVKGNITTGDKVQVCGLNYRDSQKFAIYKLDSYILPSKINLNSGSATIEAGTTKSLTATILPTNSTNKTIIWSTSDASIATVSGGTVTGKKAGTVTITAKTTNGLTANAQIKVVSGHTFGTWTTTKNATCTQVGTKSRKCTVCGKTETQTIAKTGHKSVTDKAIPATCTTDGKTEGSHCSVCGAVIKAQDTINATGHKFGNWTTTKSATCTESGTQIRKCETCGATESKSLSAKGHTEVVDKAIPATCTTDGKTEGSHCSVCGAVIKAQDTIKATGHKFGNWTTTKSATCTESGTQIRKCETCGATESKSLSAKGHTEVVDKAIPATCTTDGKTEGSHCSVCGAVIKAQEIIKATGHKFGNWTTTKSATCTESGTQIRKCETCGATESKSLSAKGHTEVVDKAIPATCTTDGKTEGSHCSVCGAVIKAQDTINATGHKFGNWTTTKSATCTESGTQIRKCETCGATESKSLSAKGHTEVVDKAIPTTCTTDGKTEGSHCSVCGAVIKAQDIIKATGHKFGNWTTTKSSTCTESGTQIRKCETCGATESKSLSAKDHTEVVDKAIPATCTTDGKTEGSHCSVCGAVIKAQTVINATGHKSSVWIVDKAASIGVKGSKHKECTVCKKVLETAEIPALSRISISKASVTLSTSTYAYDGKAKKPGVTVKLNGKTLKNGTDYTVSYSNNTKVGTAKVTITGKGNYTGSVSKTFKIKNNFKKATVSGISTKAFTGKNITQSITVKYNGKTLKNGTDYTVSYSNNKKIGTATVKIAGKGSYTGTITKTFKINPAKQEIQKLTAKSKAFFVDWAQKGSATGYEIQYATNSKFTSAKKVTITNNKTDKTTFSKLSGKKKYYVRVRSYTTVKGTKYYGAWSASKSVTTKK